MMERKSMLLLAALAAMVLVSIPGVIFKDAAVKYFNFMGEWNTASIRPSRVTAMPPMRPRHEPPPEPQQPELRFVKLSIKLPKAKQVKLAGDFNGWNADSLALERTRDGRWEAVLPLPPGRYKYVCRVDGAETLDPLNSDTDFEAGRKVSVLTVK